MNALVMYESQFGNTEQIAQAIATTLSEHGAVQLKPIENPAPPALEGVYLLVLGSPTQHHEATPDMLAWLDRLPPKILHGMLVAVFDTRYRMPKLLSGSAAQALGQEIQKRGGTLIAPPESFFVTEREGPLEAGEIERAASWANTLLDILGHQQRKEQTHLT